ncbi:hypothetical protein HDV62DRAFT_183085 [Trichoderma sp. SZMC 28011]
MSVQPSPAQPSIFHGGMYVQGTSAPRAPSAGTQALPRTCSSGCVNLIRFRPRVLSEGFHSFLVSFHHDLVLLVAIVAEFSQSPLRLLLVRAASCGRYLYPVKPKAGMQLMGPSGCLLTIRFEAKHRLALCRVKPRAWRLKAQCCPGPLKTGPLRIPVEIDSHVCAAMLL